MSQLTQGNIQALGPSFGLQSTVPDFNTETYRLLRDDWEGLGIGGFSQETFALLQLLQNYKSTGTQQFTQQGTTPPVQIDQPFTIPPNSPAFYTRSMPAGWVPGADFPPIDSVGIAPDGITFTSPTIPDGVKLTGDTVQAMDNLVDGQQLFGRVISGGPSSYQVGLWTTNPLTHSPSKTVTVTHLQPDILSFPPGTLVRVQGYKSDTAGTDNTFPTLYYTLDQPIPPLTLAGKVAGGSGNTYSVDIYMDDPTTTSPTLTVSAKQLQIDPTDTIPVGTFVKVVGYPKFTGDTLSRVWIMQVPVWL